MDGDPIRRRLRNAAESVMSLNLADLDIAELDRRIELIRVLEELSAAHVMSTCADYYCNVFREK